MKKLLEERINYWQESKEVEEEALLIAREKCAIESIRSCEENLNYIKTILYELKLVFNSENE